MGQCTTKKSRRAVFSTPGLEEDDWPLNSSMMSPSESNAELVKSSDVQPDQASSSESDQQPEGILAHVSTPSGVDAAQMTTIYRVPDEKYSSPEDVLKERDIRLMEMIDEGGFATVYKACRESNPSKVMACKMMNIGTDLNDAAKLADPKNELFVMETVKHPHIVRMFQHFIINEYLYIFLDYADYGNLYEYMRNNDGPLPEADAQKPFAQISSGLAFMHAKKIGHRDLKLSNILIKSIPDGCVVVLVADFGLSRVAFRRKTGLLVCRSYCGTPNYMAPELRLRQKYNAFAVDMYALGVILFLVVQQLYPFEEKEDKELKGLETLNPTSDIRWNPNVPLSDECIALLCSLLESNDAKRMTMREMIVHEWMADEIAIIAHLMPPLEELPKKTAIRRSSSSPDEDIRSPSQPQQKKSATKSADHRRHNKSAQRTKSKRKVKSADDKRHKPTSGKGAKGRRKSKRNKKKKKSAVNRTGSGGKHRPKSSKSRIKQPRGHSHENRGSGKGSKTKKKSNQSKNGTGGSKD